jgi:shikimate dehydrogenase
MTTFATAAALLDNSLSYPDQQMFAAILGATPSKGARSPVLWNAAFEAHGVQAKMLPFDIPAQRLETLLTTLDDIPQFVGGAIAVPHKEAVASWLGNRVAEPARSIGAVNCLYRGPDGRLRGTNTDGEGALSAYESQFGSLRGKRVLLLGLGGAGKAVAAFINAAVGSEGRLILSSRSDAGRRVAAGLKAQWLPWSDLHTVLADLDVLVNCTSVGSGDQADRAPVDAATLAALPKQAVVYDIVYQPSPSVLVSMARARGLAALAGEGMNLEQAVLAYGYAAPAPAGAAATRTAMEAAKRKLG